MVGPPPSSDGTTLDPLVRWFERDGERAMGEMAAELLVVTPELAGDGADPLGTLSGALAGHAELLADLMRGDLVPGDVRLPRDIEAHLAGLARRGTPLPGILRSFEVGHQLIWRRLATVLRELDAAERAEALEDASARLFQYIQSDTAHVATLFAREHARRERRMTSRRQEIVAGLLSGSVDPVTAEEVLGIRLAALHVAYIGWVDDAAAVDQLDLLAARVRTAAGSWQHVAVPAGERAVHGWFATTGPAWRIAARGIDVPEGTGLACGAAHPGADGFRATHRDALDARRVGEVLGAEGPVLYEDVSVAALASRDPDSARAFVLREIGPLVGDDPAVDRLRRTLATYLAQLGSPTHTARALGVHPNTVVKRLEKAEALLGRRIDPASLPLRVAVELAPLVRATTP